MKIDIDLIGWDNGVESHGDAVTLETHGDEVALESDRRTPRRSAVGSIANGKASAPHAKVSPVCSIAEGTRKVSVSANTAACAPHAKVSPVRSIERKEAKEALLAAFDMLGDDDNAGIFRDQYGLVLKDNPGQIILEVEQREVCAGDDTAEDDYICYIWQAGQWHDVEGQA